MGAWAEAAQVSCFSQFSSFLSIIEIHPRMAIVSGSSDLKLGFHTHTPEQTASIFSLGQEGSQNMLPGKCSLSLSPDPKPWYLYERLYRVMLS